MPLRDDLLKKRDSLIAASRRIHDTVSQIDALLGSLDATGEAISATQDAGSIPVMESGSATISYMEEAKTFVKQWPKHREFKIVDFSEYLATKFGAENINKQSMRGPIPRLEDAGLIYITKKGAGKVANLYMAVSDLPRKKLRTSSPLAGYRSDPGDEERDLS